MKAWVLKSNADIVLSNIDVPEIKEDEVLVKVKAAGICGSDIPRIYNNGAYFYPLITGHEFAGEVVDTDKNSTDLIGKRVGIFPLIPCNKCEPCKNKQFEMCRKYSYLGSRRDGGFAEYVAVPKSNLLELPDNVTFEQAAMLEPMAVAVHSIRRININSDDKVVVCGLGTIGMLIVMFLIEMGIKNIFVIGNKDFQKETILKLGIPEENYCDSKSYDSDKWLKEKSDDYGFDVYFECVGKNETISQAIDNTAPAGRVMLVGNPHSDIGFDKKVYWKILRHQLVVTGTWNSSFTGEDSDDWHYVLRKLNEGKISPENIITHKFSFDELEKGFIIMRDKTETFLKVMIVD